jgi:hypothetical protein
MWFLMLEFGTETCRKGGKSSEESHSLFLLLMARDLLEDLQRDSAVEASLFPFNGQGDGIKSLAARLDELLSPLPDRLRPPQSCRRRHGRLGKTSQYRIRWLLPFQVLGSRKAFCDCFRRTGLLITLLKQFFLFVPSEKRLFIIFGLKSTIL